MTFAVAILAQHGAGKFSSAEKPPAVVYVAPIEGIIDLGLAPFVQRVLKEAANANASAVILEINTFGGRVGQSCSAEAGQQSADAGVVSNSEFIESKAPIIVTRVDGNRIVVRRHRAATERGDK